MFKLLIMAMLALLLLTACVSGVSSINATDREINSACNALRRVGYDYWEMDVTRVGGRVLEVAAAIHTDHPGPEATRAFCTSR